MSKPIRITWPGIAHSSKNSRRAIRVGGKPRIVLGKDAAKDKRSLRELMSLAWARRIRSGTVFADHDVAVSIVVDKQRQQTTIEVEDRGPKRLSKGRRRDLHGCIETIMDALEGIAMDNDCQVVAVECRYVDEQEVRER